MTARRLASVPPSPPTLRPVTAEDAARAHPNNPEHQRRWLAAILVLRDTRGGWILDRPAGRQ